LLIFNPLSRLFSYPPIFIMADTGRQSFTDKAQAKLTPENEKTFTQRTGDAIKGTYDKAAAAVQPEGEKSTTQKVGDDLTGKSNKQ